MEKEIDAEIEVRVDGEKRFLLAGWNNAVPDKLTFNVTREPLLDLYSAVETHGKDVCPEIGRILDEKINCDIREEHPGQHQTLVAMINEGLV